MKVNNVDNDYLKQLADPLEKYYYVFLRKFCV